MPTRPKPGFMRPHPSREEWERRVQVVRKRLSEGAKVKEIAAELDVSRETIYRIIRAYPDLEINRATNPADWCKPMGKVRDALEKQDPKFLAWIADNRVEGTTVAEFLVSCALDAYHDETSDAAAAA